MGTHADGSFVSTGALPPPERVADLVAETNERFRDVLDGKVSNVYPALATVDPEQFGISVVGIAGTTDEAGAAGAEFTIMSVAKPFVFALACAAHGPERARSIVGANATGLPFNSIEAIERSEDGRTNPMVNAGAIATTSLIPGGSVDERWAAIAEGLSQFAGRPLTIHEDVYRSASATNHVNRELARLLSERRRISGDADEALDLYTRQSALVVTAHDLAVMGATLADGGVNPLTGERVVDETSCRHTLATMTTAGLYETSGDWLSTSAFRGRAGSAAGSSPSLPARAASGRSRRGSTPPGTAFADSLPPASSRALSASISSHRSPLRTRASAADRRMPS